MKLTRLLTICALLALLALTGCGGNKATTESEGGTESGGGTEPGASTSEDVRSFEMFVQEDYGDAAWSAAIDHFTQTRKVRHPVTEVWFAATAQEVRDQYLYDLNDAVNAWTSESQESIYVDIYGTDGKAGGFGFLMGEGTNPVLPAAPAAIGELAGWMDAAYGPGSGDEVEEWYGHILGYETRVDQYSGETVVRVLTDLTYSSSMDDDYQKADLIRTALGTAGITWATQSEVVYGDGDNIQHGQIDWMNPYAGY